MVLDKHGEPTHCERCGRKRTAKQIRHRMRVAPGRLKVAGMDRELAVCGDCRHRLSRLSGFE